MRYQTNNLAFIITGVSILFCIGSNRQFLTLFQTLGYHVGFILFVLVRHELKVHPRHSAQWLRDTGNQFAHYHGLLGKDPKLATLVKAVINNEARYISEYPYCGAFQPPPESGLSPTVNDWATNVIVNPPVNNQTVFECKVSMAPPKSFMA